MSKPDALMTRLRSFLGVASIAIAVTAVGLKFIGSSGLVEITISVISIVAAALVALLSDRFAGLIRRKSAKRIFLSYAHKDAQLAQQLAENLRSKGARVWMDSEKILPGHVVSQSLQSAIKDSDALVVIFSGSTSPWMSYELDMAKEAGINIVGAYSSVDAKPPILMDEALLHRLSSETEVEHFASELVGVSSQSK